MIQTILPHVIAIALMSIYLYDLKRTVGRFGLKTSGGLQRITSFPSLHMLQAALLIGLFVWASGWSMTPVYVMPVGVVASAAYFVMAGRQWWKGRSKEGDLQKRYEEEEARAADQATPPAS